MHPGLTDTQLIPSAIRPLIRSSLLTSEAASDTVIWCALSDEVTGQSGLYYARRQIHHASPLASDDALATELWERSARWTEI
jgi:hypothetical protein